MKYRQGWILVLMLGIGFSLGAQDVLRDTRITLQHSRGSIGHFLEEISLQAGLDFTYDASLFRADSEVEFGAQDLPLDQALDSLLGDPQLETRVIGRNIVIFKAGAFPPPADSSAFPDRQVRGRVVDARSGKALGFATLALGGSSLGTLSNEDGFFAFKLPPSIPDPILVVSYMGYKNILLPLALPLEETYTIAMDREMIPLQEVMIRYVDPVDLIRESLRLIDENYPDQPAGMTAFYRESVLRDQRCMLHFESVLDMDKKSYTRSSGRDRVQVLKGRKIRDTMEGDSVIVKLRSGVFTALSLDVIKERPDFLGSAFSDLYQYDFRDIVSYRDRQVYVIHFRQREHIPHLMLQGSIYLDRESLALVAADFEFDQARVRKHPEIFIVNAGPGIRIRPLMARYHVEYRSHEGRYHLSLVQGEVAMKVRKKRKWIGARYGISFDLAVTHVRPGEAPGIERSERLKPGRVLVDQSFDSDPEFWGPYNTIEPEASLLESIRKIEHLLQEINE